MKNFLELHPLERFKAIFSLIFKDMVLHILGLCCIALIGIATCFYHHVEGWDWLESLYFSVVTISTVGYGDFSPHTAVGKIFTIVYILLGLGLFVTVTANLGSRLISAATSGLLKKD